jgi:hypothetical protein
MLGTTWIADAPDVLVVVPARLGHGAAQADVGPEAEVGRDAPEVGLDLGLRRVRAPPLRVRRERVRVQMRRDVALAAGIAVRPPGAADVRVALPHDEVLDALPLEADRHAEPGEAGAQNADPDVPGRSLRVGARVLCDPVDCSHRNTSVSECTLMFP